jgi:hypothetical protein
MYSTETERNQENCSEQNGKGGTEKNKIITNGHNLPEGEGKMNSSPLWPICRTY